MDENGSKKPAFVFVVGTSLSGIGKGTISSSLGLLLKGYGLQTTAVKVDPYLNRDAGTISPHEHGEVYVLGDGTECDLDAGNYERFLGVNLCAANSITTGQIYKEVIQRERDGKYLGKTVQIVPHITDHIEERVLSASRVAFPDGTLPEVVIVELGGTVGDMESEPFLHAVSQFEARNDVAVCIIGIGLLIRNNGELKTKPLQHAIREMRRHSISPDLLCVRCDVPNSEFSPALREKIASGCNIAKKAIFVSGKVNSIYDVPKMLLEQNFHEHVCRKLGLLWRGTLAPNFSSYNKILDHQLHQTSYPAVKVAIVAKYTGSPDTYLSVIRALEHASFELSLRLEYTIVDAESLEGKNPPDLSVSFDHILVPGGFGNRGIEGKMAAIRQARKNKIPFLGICLGMQLFVIDHCRTVLNLTNANSTEFDPSTTCPVIQHLSEYGDHIVQQLGGTMRLGNQTTLVEPNTAAALAYAAKNNTPNQTITITERHRHRYEVSPHFLRLYRDLQIEKELRISGWSAETHIPDIVENSDTGPNAGWWAVGCQYHPEFISRNDRAHELFVAFLGAQKK